MKFRTKCEVRSFLEGLQWKRMSKEELDKTMSEFFGKEMEGEDSTAEDNNEVDYSLIYTTGEYNSVSNFIDMEIWFLNMRDGRMLITGAELLDYNIK